MTKPIPGPIPATKPNWTPPAGTTDCHMHIFGPGARFPLWSGRDYTPPDCLMDDYKRMCATVGIERTVVVHPSIYAFDNAVSEQAVRDLGAAGRGVAVLPAKVTAAEVARLHDIGFRGARFNMVSSGGTPREALETVATLLAERGWHIQMFVRARNIAELEDRIRALPVDVVFDHIAGVDPAAGLEQPGFVALLRLLETGRAWVKLSGAYRVDHAGQPYAKADPFARRLIAAAPERMVWGTDWPHPNLEAGPMPDDGHLLNTIARWTGDDAIRRKILVDNPARLYDFG